MGEDTKSVERIYSKDGTPFATESQAVNRMSRDRFSRDDYEVVKEGDGFVVLLERAVPDEVEEEVAEPTPKPADGEDYLEVEFHAASDPGQTKQVPIVVNGECIVVQREQRVTLPMRFLEAIDHAQAEIITQRPGENRKREGKVRRYSYTKLGPGDRETFLRMKQEGTAKSLRDLERYGVDGPPAED